MAGEVLTGTTAAIDTESRNAPTAANSSFDTGAKGCRPTPEHLPARASRNFPMRRYLSETTIFEACESVHLEQVRALFREYTDELAADLCFQGFEQELASLPGKYSPPGGILLLATVRGEPVGCGAVRPLFLEQQFADPEATVCEMKRLYVRPDFRRKGIGRLIAERLVAFGRDAGYDRMLLDTLDRLTPALTMYQDLGFVEVPAYYSNPLPGVVYLGIDLKSKA